MHAQHESVHFCLVFRLFLQPQQVPTRPKSGQRGAHSCTAFEARHARANFIFLESSQHALCDHTIYEVYIYVCLVTCSYFLFSRLKTFDATRAAAVIGTSIESKIEKWKNGSQAPIFRHGNSGDQESPSQQMPIAYPPHTAQNSVEVKKRQQHSPTRPVCTHAASMVTKVHQKRIPRTFQTRATAVEKGGSARNRLKSVHGSATALYAAAGQLWGRTVCALLSSHPNFFTVVRIMLFVFCLHSFHFFFFCFLRRHPYIRGSPQNVTPNVQVGWCDSRPCYICIIQSVPGAKLKKTIRVCVTLYFPFFLSLVQKEANRNNHTRVTCHIWQMHVLHTARSGPHQNSDSTVSPMPIRSTPTLPSPTKGLQSAVGVFETAEKQRNVAYAVTNADTSRLPSPPISWRPVTACRPKWKPEALRGEQSREVRKGGKGRRAEGKRGGRTN